MIWPIVVACVLYFWIGIGVSVFSDAYSKMRSELPASRIVVVLIWPVVCMVFAFFNE